MKTRRKLLVTMAAASGGPAGLALCGRRAVRTWWAVRRATQLARPGRGGDWSPSQQSRGAVSAPLMPPWMELRRSRT